MWGEGGVFIVMQESPPLKLFLVGRSSPFMRLAEHLTFRFVLAASDDRPVGENPRTPFRRRRGARV